MKKSINDIADLLYRNTNITSKETKIIQNENLLSIYDKFGCVISLNQRTGSISITTMNNEIVFLPNDDNGRDLSELVRLFKYNSLVLRTIESICTDIFYGYEVLGGRDKTYFRCDYDRGVYISSVIISKIDLSKDYVLRSALHTEISPNYGLLVGPTIHQYVMSGVIYVHSWEIYEDIPINYVKPTGQFYMSGEYIMKKIDEYYNKIKNENFSV